MIFYTVERSRLVSDIVVILLVRLSTLPLSPAIQRVHAYGVTVPRGHGDGLASRIRVLQKFPKLLLPDLESLVRGSIGHLHHRTEQVEAVCDVGAASEDDDEQEKERVAEN